MTGLTPTSTPPQLRICGVNLHAVQVDQVLEMIQNWMRGERKFHYITSTNVNNVAIALEDPDYFRLMEEADISLPDGVPFLWYGRSKGYSLPRRCGIDEVMEALFEASNRGAQYRHFFYGNSPEVLEDLRVRLLESYPNLQIAGMHSPPFRALTPEEDRQDVQMINDSKADFLWVSLGCPRQERWVYDHKDQLDVVVAGGAGAVFNFFSGDKMKAPGLIRYLGFEWLFRLVLEPRRLFTRYCVRYPKFAVRFVKEAIDQRRGRAVQLPAPVAEIGARDGYTGPRSNLDGGESDK